MILLFIVLILSISGSCASDNISLDENEDILTSQDFNEDLSINDDNHIIKNNMNSSFSDLSTTINSTSKSIELTNDYIFNEESDENYVKGIVIEKNDFVINGNNHIIDAKNKAGLFTITANNVTLNNIIFKNSNNVALNITGIGIVTNNVTFMNCGINNTQGGAIHLSNAIYESNNDKFIDNYAKYGSAIYAIKSNVTVSNGTFKNNESIDWALIYGISSDLKIDNTVFANITSRYATAVYGWYSITHIRNSKFQNLFANITAGAVGLKITSSTIENCEFINVSSSRNGGAIFADFDRTEGFVSLNNTLFENCSSQFGGAYLHLAATCLITNSTFKNNFADYDGGAVYISTAEVEITDSTFTDNNVNVTYEDYPTYGGAVFLDNSIVEVTDTKFTNNHAVNGSALFFYECDYVLNNLVFNENINPIYTYFEETSERNNLTGTDNISDDVYNNTYYPDAVFGAGKKLELNPYIFNFTELPEKFNLVDYNLVTPVKNQGSMASCWAFGIIGALESALLKATNVTYDFSENNLQNSMLIYSKYGSISSSETGTASLGYGYLLNWFGVLSQEYDEYDELGKISPLIRTEEDIHIQDLIFIDYRIDPESINNVKKAIVDYGALMGVLCFGATEFDEGPETYNENTYALYTPTDEDPNHAICVVGWDDNFPKENFLVTPPGDGAWIVKNSWGSEWGDNGYFYVSYYDKSLCPFDRIGLSGEFVGIKIENTLQYNKNYQYDFIGIFDYMDDPHTTCTSVNKFIAYEDDVIAAVGSYFDQNTNYTIEIMINGSSVYKQQGESHYFGYSTINLHEYVSIKKGDEFAVAITTENYFSYSTGSRVKYMDGVSLIYTDFSKASTASDGTVQCIKVYTLPEPFSAEKIVETYSQRKAFKVNVTQSNVNVSITFDNITMTNMSDINGIASFDLPLMEHGTHPIYVSYNGSTIVSSVTVLSTIDVDDEIKVAYNANKNTTVTFYDINGTALSSITLPLPNEIGNYTLSFTNYATGEVRNITIKVISRFLVHEDVTGPYSGINYAVVVAGDDGNAVGEGEIVTFEMMGMTAEIETGSNGIAGIYLPYDASPGTYTIYATYKGETVSNTITITHLIKSNETVTVHLTDDTLLLEADLHFSYEPAVNCTVTFELNGKTYTTATDGYGIAKVLLSKNDIKNLKAGKHTIKISFEKDSIYTVLDVKQPLSSSSTVTIKNIDKTLVLKAALKYDNIPLANKMITFKFKGKTYTAKTDKNGIAKVTIKKNVIKKLKAGGKYTAEISYLHDTIKTTVKVKQLISSKKIVTVKKNAKKLVLKATLKDGKKSLKNKKITFKFNGKTYNAKTNKKGIAKVTINKNVINKLKVGKKYSVKIAYLTNVLKTSVNVKK